MKVSELIENIEDERNYILSPFGNGVSIMQNPIFIFLLNIHPDAKKYIASISVPAVMFHLMNQQFNNSSFAINNNKIENPHILGFDILLSDDDKFHINYLPKYALDIGAMGGCADKYFKENI